MRKEVISALPVICKMLGHKNDFILEENGRSAGNDLQTILGKSSFIQLDFITEVRLKDENLVKQFEKLNKKYTTCCAVENFAYPYIEVYSRSFHDIIPFDTQTKNIMEAYSEIKEILTAYKVEYENGRKKAKLKYKIFMRIPETYKSGKVESI